MAYKTLPTPLLTVSNITPHSVDLSATMVGDSCVRGFLISKYNVPDLERLDNDVLWCPYSTGNFEMRVPLVYREVYFVRAFVYYRGQADRPEYSETMVVKAK